MNRIMMDMHPDRFAWRWPVLALVLAVSLLGACAYPGQGPSEANTQSPKDTANPPQSNDKASGEQAPGPDWPPVDQYPSARLSNGRTDAVIMLPDAEEGYYRGPRFDWSGMVVRVRYAGHTFLGPTRALAKHDPTNPEHAAGTAEAFGTESPMGYAKAGPGGRFMKLGVGLLKKPDDQPYAPRTAYPIVKAGDWKIERGPDSRYLTFTQSLKGPRGLAYVYTKTLTLAPDQPVLRITRTLKNTGDQPIQTTHGGHNFLTIDDTPIGPGYQVGFGFQPKPDKPWHTADRVRLTEGRLLFTKPLENRTIEAALTGWSDQASDNRITVHNGLTRAAVTMQTNQPLSQLMIDANAQAICPQPIIHLEIAPGQTKTWQTTYRFSISRP